MMKRDIEPLLHARAQRNGRSVVAVIGVDQYCGYPQLQNAVRDALGVQKLLVERFAFVAPFPPLVDGGATKGAIVRLISDDLRDYLVSDDELVVFFAGHGCSRVDRVGDAVTETGFLVPVEATRMRGP